MGGAPLTAWLAAPVCDNAGFEVQEQHSPMLLTRAATNNLACVMMPLQAKGSPAPHRPSQKHSADHPDPATASAHPRVLAPRIQPPAKSATSSTSRTTVRQYPRRLPAPTA